MLEVWLAIPTANRHRCTECFAKWRDRGYHTLALLDAGAQEIPNAHKNIWVDEYPGYFSAANACCKATEAEVVVTGGDDIDPDPRVTAEQIATEFIDHFPDLFGVMQPIGDSYAGTDRICGSPWLGRDWINRAYGGRGPFWPGYKAFYGDEELLAVARKLDVMWQRKDIQQHHHHWSRGGTADRTDYQMRNHNKYWRLDQNLFRSRSGADFPDHQPLIYP